MNEVSMARSAENGSSASGQSPEKVNSSIREIINMSSNSKNQIKQKIGNLLPVDSGSVEMS